MGDEIARFVASLAIPADRKSVVLAELLDHAACATDAACREGRDPDAAARAALGDLEAMRRALEAVEPAFRVSRTHAVARGLVAAAVIALVLDQGGPLMRGVVGALLVLGVAAACAPSRLLDLLRAELRAPRVRGTVARGVPIGPATTYLYTTMSAPFLVWIALIVVRAIGGNTTVDSPISAMALPVTVYAVLLVEGLRARRHAEA